MHSEIVDLSRLEEAYINAEIWLPEKNPSNVMIIIHGLGEHIGRYATHFAEFYLKNETGLILFDLPGHGLSSGKRGHINKPILLLEIIDQLIKTAKDRFPHCPLFLYGHSLGGEILLWYTLVRSPDVQGVIISAPFISENQPVPQFKLFLARTMDKLMPSFTMNNGLEPSLLSKNPEVVNAYKSDPLVHDQVSARTGMMMINRGAWIHKNASTNKTRTLLMVGDQEGIVNLEDINNISKKMPYSEFILWPGLYHEMHNEPEKEQVMNHVLNWMKGNGHK